VHAMLLWIVLWLGHMRAPDLCFETKEPAKEIWQCLSFVLLAQEKIFLCAEICLETMNVNQEFLLELCLGCDGSWQ
jgi:hypothetical protein